MPDVERFSKTIMTRQQAEAQRQLNADAPGFTCVLTEDANDWIFTTVGPADAAASLRPSSGFGFAVQVQGSDLVVSDGRATWFGGPNDPTDPDPTASGVSLVRDRAFLGCALPMDGFHSAATDGSPIPRLPWHSKVHVRNRQNGREITVELIDLGPAKATGKAIDLSEAAFVALADATHIGVIPVDYRIPGGAPHAQPAGMRDASLTLAAIPAARRLIAQQIATAFASEGYGPLHQAAAIANAMQESSLDPNQITTGPRERSIGLFQLNTLNGGLGVGHDEQELRDPARNIRLILDALADQPGFRTALTLPQAVDVFVRKIERPADPDQEVPKRLTIAQTLMA